MKLNGATSKQASDSPESRRVVLALLFLAASGCTIDDLLHGTATTDGGGPSPVTQVPIEAASPDATRIGDAAKGAGDELAPMSTKDATAPDDSSPSEDQEVVDAGTVDVSTGDNSAYYAINDTTRWSFFSVGGVANGVTKYSGVAFDGRYLYFVPNFSPPNVLRYDTQGGFTDTTSWTYYSPMPAIEAAGGSNTGTYTYLGGAFDGRYVYLAPFSSNQYAVRYDTKQPFSQSSSWAAFNAGTLDSTANYWGVVSDGRYAYFVPNKTTKVLAYDNTAIPGDAGPDFTASSSFTIYDLGSGNQGFWGGVYDGTYVYLAPFSGSIVARHDSLLPISAAWDVGTSGFDLNNNFVLGSALHYWGAAYDGSRIYMVPNGTPWTVAAYRTSGTFDDYESWEVCALGTQLFGGQASGAPFVGAAFDGRRLFLVPYGTPGGDSGAPTLPVVAFDTTQSLCPTDVRTAYTTFDPTGLDGGTGALGFEGAAFDGQYIYLVPHSGSVVARFQAKSVNSGLSPSTYTGSWW